MNTYDVLILGGGPAGLSAALYTLRAGMKTLIIAKDIGELDKAHLVENYFGLAQPLSGRELVENGRRQAASLGATLWEAEATSLAGGPPYTVMAGGQTAEGSALIVATGRARRKPPIAGLPDYEGRGVSYCAMCDGFFYRGKRVGVLGEGAYAAGEAEYLAGIAAAVTVFTNGLAPEPALEGRTINTRKITGLQGESRLEALVVDDGSVCELDGLFVAMGSASASDFASKLGLMTEDGALVTDQFQATNLPGVYAAGDCTSRKGDLNQVATAVAKGAIAGSQAVKYVKTLKKA